MVHRVRTSGLDLPRERWVWIVPPALFVVIVVDVGVLSAIVATGAAVGYLLLVRRRPATAISLLMVLILFNSVLLPVLFKVGLSSSVVKAASFWKEGIIVGALLALTSRQPFRHRDALDVAAVGFLALSAIYLFFPGIVGSASGLSFQSRALAWRSSVLYVLAFLAVRHLRLGRIVVDQILRRAMVVIVMTAVIGLFEAAFSSTWNHFAVDDLGVTTYRHIVLGEKPGGLFSLGDVRSFGTLHGHTILRIGSVLLDYVGIGFVFAIGLGIGAELIARGEGRPWLYVSMPVLGAALLLTQTRSAMVAAVVTVAFALRGRTGKSLAHRAHFARILAVALVLLVPVVLATGALNRFTQDTAANSLHRDRAKVGFSVMVHQPLGRGLGTTGGGVVAPEQTPNVNAPTIIATESQYLLVGTQLGLLGAVLYVTIIVLCLRLLLGRRRDNERSLARAAMGNVAVGVAVGAAFTQPFVTIEVALLFWVLLGLAVSVADDGPEHGEVESAQATHGDLLAAGDHA